ncbi:preprotein translocase subunit YajC [Candidatus Sumerlaeota bacterium]|nr:preprotein translocase subunit YajC [Candidatus Sumerlaeota bacterium]
MISLIQRLALAAASTSEEAPPPAEGLKGFAEQHPLQMMVILVGFMILMWYLILGGPQRRQAQQREAMISAVQKGDRVVTIGGIHGKVKKVDREAQTVTVEVSKGAEIDFSQAAISTIHRARSESPETERG